MELEQKTKAQIVQEVLVEFDFEKHRRQGRWRGNMNKDNTGKVLAFIVCGLILCLAGVKSADSGCFMLGSIVLIGSLNLS